MLDYAGFLKAAGSVAPNYLKIDIEGYEYEALASFLSDCQKTLDTTGVDTFPEQIALELHYQSAFFDMPDEVLLAFSNFLFRIGGYVVAHRRDNIGAYMCTEVLLVRISK